jgi:hypothetical protein
MKPGKKKIVIATSKAYCNYYSHIQSILQLKDTELCYIISGESEVDGTFLPFADAFARVKSSSSGTLLTNMAATKLFLKTEHMGGRTPSFWGIAAPALQ